MSVSISVPHALAVLGGLVDKGEFLDYDRIVFSGFLVFL